MNTGSLIGFVKDGQFRVLAPVADAGTLRQLTTMQMQEARLPDEVDLTPYEGQALMVRGHDSGGWVYGAEIMSYVASPIVPALADSILDVERTPAMVR
jgi:hypothetical protein